MSLFDTLIINTLPLVPKPIVGFFSKNYIAGPLLEDAVNAVKDLNAKGIMATLDLLGEEVTHKIQSLDAAKQYIDMLEIIDRLKLDCNISLKPTHLGLHLDQEFGFTNIRRIVNRAKELNNFVRIDMEDHTVTTTTIEMYIKLKKEFDGHVGTVLQSYLHRTSDDIRELVKHESNIRLCKGIYVEPENIAYKEMSKINQNYNQSIDELLKNKIYTGIATHDEELVEHAFKRIDEYKLDKSQYEFQMLLGVTENLRDRIIEKGHRLRVYVPYGKDWYEYSIRRLKENPRMAKMVMLKVFGL